MNWTLVAVIAVFVVFIAVGCARGLIKTLFSMLAMVLSVVITTFAAPYVSDFLSENTKWDDSIRHSTESFLESQGILKDANQEINLDEVYLPASVSSSIEENAEKYLNQGIEVYNDYVIDTVADMVFMAVVYVITFVVAWTVISIIGILLNIVSRLPVIRQLNSLGGGIIGFVFALLFVWVLFVVLTVASNTEFAKTVYEQIEDNEFLTFLYKNNIIMNFLTRFM